MSGKKQVNDLAIFGGIPVFATAKSTSNLLQPDFERFMEYSDLFLQAQRYIDQGPAVQLLERRLAEFHGVSYCITFCSGFWALALTIAALVIPGKREVIMPSLTYRRMPDIVAWLGLIPHFCEVDSETLSVSAATVAACINENTALILAPHPIVNCCDVGGLLQLAEDRKLPLVFDSVESVYESTAEGKVGGQGHAEAFSLHACKLINGFGGGYVTTQDTLLANQLISLRHYGMDESGNVVLAHGMNASMNDMHAAMALASLDDVERQVLRNQKRYRVYQSKLAHVPGLRLVTFDEQQATAYKNIVVELLDDWPLSREETIRILNAERILARAYYAPPLHCKSMEFAFIAPPLPVTEWLADRFMNLPCGHLVSNEDIGHITDILAFIVAQAEPISTLLRSQVDS
ncbi:DegT/DnrJ/EryC1/StrS family aminotransferase [Ferrovum myxofaciens]|jgi:dTDP-4-amino-4,6-dideoxygalactose transaminase|uniref:DegT/DnrJ/EryC1/StrS family aminotransferase n=1 Tax=Ferrovum myxofaciens TaxID=416213 RepID=UPI0004E2628F|nr:aminotransferase class I/II-fold pyridoxal phosphate-dependent enzyme [Ferrovum myxofaciens]